MKPILLNICAFGPYAGSQIIDFAELKGRNFFLIHGPTGAGKTTILDAMCYSLYGDTSGAVRSAKAMRSDFADPACLTEVAFAFSIGSLNYRVHRSPEQERPKKSGTGTTIASEQATLWLLDSDLSETDVLATGTRKVTERIEELLGFRSEQFRQVVLLPQGDFRRLLLATSEERQKIMQMLFKTDLFQVIERKLKEQATELKQEIEASRKKQSWLLQEAETESAVNLSVRIGEHKVGISGLTQEIKQAQQESEKAQAALTKGKMDQTRIEEHETAVVGWRELEAKLPVVQEKKQELNWARLAVNLADVEKTLGKRRQDAEFSRQAEIKAEHILQEVIAKQNDVVAGFNKEKGREIERKEAVRQCSFLEDIATKHRHFTEAATIAQQAELIANKAKDKLVSAKDNLQKLTNKCMELETEKVELAKIAAQSDYYKTLLKSANQVLEKHKILKDVQAKLAMAQKNVDNLAITVAHKQEQVDGALVRLEEMQTELLAGQAAVLAAKLTEGNPCPVCGALHHPRLAQTTKIIPTEEEVKSQKARVDSLNRELGNEKNKLQDNLTEREINSNRLTDLADELGAGATTTLVQCQLDATQAEGKVQEANKALIRVVKLDSAISVTNKQKCSVETEVKTLEGLYTEAETSYIKTQGVWKEREADLPDEYRLLNTLQQAQKNAVLRAENLQVALEKAQAAYDKINLALATAQTDVANKSQNVKAALAALELVQQEFTVRLVEAGFSDQVNYQKAKKSLEYMDRLQEAITRFDGDYASAQGRLERAMKEVEGLIMPDLAALEHKKDVAWSRQIELVSRWNQLRELTEREEIWHKQLTDLGKVMALKEEEYGIVGMLAMVADGKGLNKYGVNLQRFVLGALLDDVAAAANQRLKTMSRGRYYLRRTLDRARRNAAAGLELEVFDNNTGIARNVNTLSGGETFLASLSLALGLADVVQSYSGGIRLDTIFVDEGFGSLDPETLDFALKSLIDLQQGGRLVGIISHVPELKERIDARLEIQTQSKGSWAHFVVG